MQISAFRNGTKEAAQNGQDEFRLESSEVQPAMISSSYTRELQLRHSEQLDIRTWTQTHCEVQPGRDRLTDHTDHTDGATSIPAPSWLASHDLRRGYTVVGVSDRSRSLPTDSEL